MTKQHDKDNSPRLIGRKEAAAYLGIGESTFSLWVSTHKLPPCIPGTRKWDKRAIDDRLDEISGISPGKVEDPYKKWERESKAKRRDSPRHGLDKKLENILVAKSHNPDLDKPELIPGAGPVSMKTLLDKRLIARAGAGDQIRYAVTDEGNDEAVRIFEKWCR